MTRMYFYTFDIQDGPSYYSEQTDEDFYSTKPINYALEVSHKQIVQALIDMYSNSTDTPQQKVIKTIYNMLDAQQLEQLQIDKTLQQLVNESIHSTPEQILEDIIDIEDYITSELEDELKDYFETVAYEECIENL